MAGKDSKKIVGIIIGILVLAIIIGILYVFLASQKNEPASQGGKPHRTSVQGTATPSQQENAASSSPSASAEPVSQGTFDLSQIPPYSGEPYTVVNNNVPFFDGSELQGDAQNVESFETYSQLDELGRCGPGIAAVGEDLMPTEDRESIREIRPSGWKQAMYDIVESNALYNRCHLIGYQLTAENANPLNLITGTRYMNVQGMLPFENMVADYVRETGNHVLYRVTPVFEGDELVARGVLMEAQSIEDEGDGVSYCVYTYNVQPGIGIDYATGESWLEENAGGAEETFVLNTGTRKFHKPDCTSVADMAPSRRQEYTGPRDTLLAQGYKACGVCRP